MHKIIYVAIAMIGLLPGALMLVPAIGVLFAQPPESQVPPAQGRPMFWVHSVELRIGGLRVACHPRPWKTVLLAVGMLLYVTALVSMLFGSSLAAANP